MNKLSEKEIEAIRKRAEKATDGPWICDENVSGYIHSKYLFNVVASVIEYNDDDSEHITLSNTNHENNRRFIAHAREDIPKLLAEIDRLNKIIEECGKDLGSIEGNILGTIGSFTHVSVRLSDIMDVKDKLEEAIGNERK